eukprot:10104578-Ditylum_brightwellii.AAC.1
MFVSNPWHHMRIVIQINSTESNNNNGMLWSQGENGLVRQIVVYVKNVLAEQDCGGKNNNINITMTTIPTTTTKRNYYMEQ